jgi:tetratricopeptide (TPR) repeat protein
MKEHLISLQEAETNLLSAATYLAENIGSSDGHAEAVKEIVKHYLAKNEVDLAAQLSDSLEDTFVRDRLLSAVAEKCAALDDDEYALQLADAIEDVGFQSQARERIAAQKASKHEFERAFEIAETLPHSSDALAEIAINQAATGDETAALETISQIEFHNSKVNALQALAAHFQSRGEAEKAGELFQQATVEAKEIEFTEEKIRALHSIANHYIDAARFDKAIETLADAKVITEGLDGAHRDTFLALISLDFLRAGSIDLADRTLDLVQDKTQIASCLTGFATQFETKGERAEALETLEEAYAILKSQRENEIRDSQARFNVFSEIAIRFAMFDKTERAIEIALENPIESDRNSALAQIARICVLRDEDEFPRQALEGIEDDASRMFALIALSDTKNKSEKNDEALHLLNEAEALCETVPQLASRSEAFNEFAIRFHKYGETGKARELCLENLRTISRILDESHKAVALAQLAEIYETLGFELNEAEQEVLRTILRKANW